MARNIDLQCHTTASDGKLSSKKLVGIAIKNKLSSIAITDHDTIGGIDEALAAARNRIEIIPGVEITCDDKKFADTHILGLFVEHKNKKLNGLLKRAKRYRERQKRDIIKKFQRLGFNITYNDVKRVASGEIGRPHIAQIIIDKNPDKASSIGEVFDKYLATGKKAYVRRRNKISVKQAIDAIHAANGLAFAAHPGVYRNFNQKKFVDFFIKNGGDGIETYYPYESSRHKTTKSMSDLINKKFRNIVRKNKILETGGSDFHGNEGQVLGKMKVPYSILEQLKKQIRPRNRR